MLTQMGKKAKAAARVLSTAPARLKNAALLGMADALVRESASILQANQMDLEAGRAAGMTKSLLDRLSLSPGRIEGMADGLRQVAAFQDPIGKVDGGTIHPNGMQILKTRVPLGVVGMIYEARPNVTADAAGLCLKSGNAVILRGGKEAIHSNMAIASVMREAIGETGLPKDSIQLVEDTTRASATAMMQLNGYLDVLIPRGGAGLIRAVVEHATVPVIETGVGNCHVYIDFEADLEMAAQIVCNAKTSRPSVCNACETLLVHKAVAEKALPMVESLLSQHNVELRGCGVTRFILGDTVKEATEEDYATEFSDYILAVKVVGSFQEAVDHIAQYSSGHSECIVTRNYENARRFTEQVDAAAVYVNASTRFTDGGEFGMGAEIGISTQKLHARGPMGINELTSVKFVVFGDGQIR